MKNLFDKKNIFKKITANLISLAMSTSIGAICTYKITAGNNLGDNITFKFDEPGNDQKIEGILTISGSGPMYNFTGESSPLVDRKDDIKKIIIEEGVTTIGESMFTDCSILESVTIPSSVKTICENAFNYCPHLTKVIFKGDNSVEFCEEAFGSLMSKPPIYIPEGSTYNGEEIIPDENGKYADVFGDAEVKFKRTLIISGDTENITKADIEAKIKPFNKANYTSLIIEEGVKTIGNMAFDCFTNLQSISLPNSLTDIGVYSFNGCRNISSVDIPSGVTNIKMYAFSGCSELASITIPEDVTDIGAYAFSNCNELISVNILGNMTNIGNGAFNNCSKLKSITFKYKDPIDFNFDGYEVFDTLTTDVTVYIPKGSTYQGTEIVPDEYGLYPLAFGEATIKFNNDKENILEEDGVKPNIEDKETDSEEDDGFKSNVEDNTHDSKEDDPKSDIDDNTHDSKEDDSKSDIEDKETDSEEDDSTSYTESNTPESKEDDGFKSDIEDNTPDSDEVIFYDPQKSCCCCTLI